VQVVLDGLCADVHPAAGLPVVHQPPDGEGDLVPAGGEGGQRDGIPRRQHVDDRKTLATEGSPGRQIDRPGRAGAKGNGDYLAAFSQDRHGAVAAFETEGLDVRPAGFRHPQPVECRQRDQRVLGGGAEPGRHQQGADFVTVQAGAWES
jgi:hypothetical protein